MKRNSQNAEGPNELPSPNPNDTAPEEKNQPFRNTYYYDDATGYEIYREETEDEEESDRSDQNSE